MSRRLGLLRVVPVIGALSLVVQAEQAPPAERAEFSSSVEGQFFREIRGREKPRPTARRKVKATQITPGIAEEDLASLCATRLMPGPRGTRDRRVDLSAAHAVVREFSVDSAFAASDLALASAMQNDASLTVTGLPASLANYATALPDVCAASAGTGQLGTTRVQMTGHVATVQPGTGSADPPPDTQIVVIDLRNVPAVDQLAGILANAVAPAMRTAPAQTRWVRRHDGPVDEFFTPFSAYSTGLTTIGAASTPTAGNRDLPIVFLIGGRIAPEAAALAASMRAARRAWLAGEAVPTAIAELGWAPMA